MFIFIRLINCRIRMFKAVKMKRLKFLLLSFVLGCAMLAGAQTPEVFPLWPQGVKEN